MVDVLKYLLSLAAIVQAAAALPSLLSASSACSNSSNCDLFVPISDASIHFNPNKRTAAQNATAAVHNCGPITPCLVFNPEEQHVSVSGHHAYQSPGPNDVRGPCPGLNAAANHNYIPRSGLLTVNETIHGLAQLYGMAPDLAKFLAVYAVAVDGDIVTGLWSIGGPTGPPANGTGRYPEGISYSHNAFEGDASLARCDAYLNDGDAHSLSPTRFRTAYEVGTTDNRYTFDRFARLFAKNVLRSIQSNPYYFAQAYTSTIIAPSMYTFAINFFSNHSHLVRNGYLGGETFKKFMGVREDYPNFTWLPGQERIPDNWYRRPSASQFGLPDLFKSLVLQNIAYPAGFRFGGNTRGVNTYQAIDITLFTSGTYHMDTLFEGNNFECFFYTTQFEFLPTLLANRYNNEGPAMKMVEKNLDRNFDNLSCPMPPEDNPNTFYEYPGYQYNPKAPSYEPSNC